MNTPEAHQVPNAFWRVSVKALIFDERQRLLALMADDQTWEMPGGGWEHDEGFEQCIRRELSEEIQVGVKEIGPALFVYTGKTENGRPKMSIAVRVSIDDAVVTPTDDDLVEARFVSREEFLELPFSESERAVLAYADKIWI